MTDIKEAAHCPKCGTLGELKFNRPRVRAEGKWWDIGVYHCVNEGCTFYGSGWAVQSDENGIVYERAHGPRGVDKSFPHLTPGQLSRGRAVVEDALKREMTNDPRGE